MDRRTVSLIGFLNGLVSHFGPHWSLLPWSRLLDFSLDQLSPNPHFPGWPTLSTLLPLLSYSLTLSSPMVPKTPFSERFSVLDLGLPSHYSSMLWPPQLRSLSSLPPSISLELSTQSLFTISFSWELPSSVLTSSLSDLLFGDTTLFGSLKPSLDNLELLQLPLILPLELTLFTSILSTCSFLLLICSDNSFSRRESEFNYEIFIIKTKKKLISKNSK